MNRRILNRPWRQVTYPLLAGAFLLLLLSVDACEKNPVKIGLIAGLSGRGADYGIAGRNGVTLAVEQRNRAGGLKGRPIQLIVRDDRQNTEMAREAFTDLMDRQVSAIIGPMTSAMATAIVPMANEHRLVLISPTVTTDYLSGIDDYFYRAISPNKVYAQQMAYHMRNVLSLDKVGIFFDLGNAAYTESWNESFSQQFQNLEGEVVFSHGFHSGPEVRFYNLTRKALQSEAEGLLIIAGAIDTAMFCQQVRKLNSSVVLASPDWAATEKLMDLGGKAVEGVLVGQFFDPSKTLPDYLSFRRAYLDRFNAEPGLPSVTAYDAANLLFAAIENQAQGQPLKKSLQSIREFKGVQGMVNLDRFGDARRETLITIVQNGRFHRVD